MRLRSASTIGQDDGIVVVMKGVEVRAEIWKRDATYKDLCDVPEEDGTCEILNGDLWVSPQPRPRH